MRVAPGPRHLYNARAWAVMGAWPPFPGPAMPHSPDSTPSSTKRQLVAHQLEREIASGAWPESSRLPTEHQLAERFGVGRQTIRFALADLAARGLVKSRQGVGSVVLRQSAVPEYSQSLESIRALASYARNTTVRVLRMDDQVLGAALAAQIGVAPGETWCQSQALRYAAGQVLPMALTSVWVPLASRKAMLAANRSALPVFLEIQKARGHLIDKVHQVLGAHRTQKHEAGLLECALREPMLRIQRWYYAADGSVMEMSDTLHPQSRFQYAMTLRYSGTLADAAAS